MGKGTLPKAVLVSLGMIASFSGCGRSQDSTAPATNSASVGGPRTAPQPVRIRAGYFYSYMSRSHADSLASAGFNRAIVKFIGDSLGARGRAELGEWTARGARAGLDVVPSWALQSRALLARLNTPRRYTPPGGAPEAGVGCPLDSAFWRLALLGRANEILGLAPDVSRLALDLEIYTGSVHHYREPCVCERCLDAFRAAAAAGMLPDGPRPARLPATAAEASALVADHTSGVRPALEAFEEARATALLSALVAELARAHPGLELGVFDLDLDSFVHRSFAHALVAADVKTVDYCERTYGGGANGARDARAALRALGVNAPLVGGLWLKKWTPSVLPSAIRTVLGQADGYFVFTTFSLWAKPSERTGAYGLQGTPAQYWSALRGVNR